MSSASPSPWKDRLATLPGSPSDIPAFYFAHGSPLLVVSKDDPASQNPRMRPLVEHTGLESPLANFLRDFGPALLSKYQPKGILVFSAHWETEGEQLGALRFPLDTFTGAPDTVCFIIIIEKVTDYGEENPLLMDFYGFDPETYKLKFDSRGDATLSRRVVELFQQVCIYILSLFSPLTQAFLIRPSRI